MRLIDADALMPKLKFIRDAEHQIYGKKSWGFASKCITAIEDAPTIEEPKKGKWLPDRWLFWKCSACGFPSEASAANVLYKYCPVCGARMEGEENEAD